MFHGSNVEHSLNFFVVKKKSLGYSEGQCLRYFCSSIIVYISVSVQINHEVVDKPELVVTSTNSNFLSQGKKELVSHMIVVGKNTF